MHGPDFVDFSADFKENFTLYVQLPPAVKVAVLPLPDPVTKSMVHATKPQNPHEFF